jgi:transcriptional regulator with XRE-family HTH domain
VNGDYRVIEDATARRQLLGRRLRRLRTDIGLTQAEVATRLGCGQSKINKMERTLCGISPEALSTLIELYEVAPDKEAELRKLVAQDRKNGPPRTSMSAFTVLSDLELEAAEIRCWHSERIPGPLKSQLYALKQWGPGLTRNKVTEVLRRQMNRVRVLTMPNPPRYRAVLSESSLHRMPGGRTPEMVIDQAAHLLRLMTDHEQLELRILPFTADIPFVDSDFQLLMFNNSEFSDFAYIECPGGSRTCEKKHELDKFDAHWTALNAAALDVTDTRIFLTRLLEEMAGQPAGALT